LLRENAFALIPAAPQANYLDVDESSVTNTRARRMTVRGSGETSLGKCDRVLVVAVSSDQLYSAADVHLGADILSNLGKPVKLPAKVAVIGGGPAGISACRRSRSQRPR
jgi:NADPH-dependent 2,4-dienoyl-CoA reductase/sulfur reductase-like enzyme